MRRINGKASAAGGCRQKQKRREEKAGRREVLFVDFVGQAEVKKQSNDT